MLTLLFWELFARAVLSLLLLGLLTGLLSRWIARDYRRWACRREMQRFATWPIGAQLGVARHTTSWTGSPQRRAQTDGRY